MSSLTLSFLLFFVVCSRFQTHSDSAQSSQSQSQSQSPSPSPSSSSDLIEKACQKSADKNFCINLLRSDRDSSNADMKGLVLIALNNVEKTAAATSLSIKVTLDNPETDMEPVVQDALNDCDQHYLTLIDLVEDSIDSLVSNNNNNYDEFNQFMKAVVADLDGCDAGVKGQGGAATQVAARNQDLRKLINTSLSIFHSISKLSHNLSSL